jgi:hypothetical protein
MIRKRVLTRLGVVDVIVDDMAEAWSFKLQFALDEG